jgi:hypothetical protein
MKTVIIVSKCSRVTKINPSESWYEFHFRGVCAGNVVKKIILKGKCQIGVEKGEEYLLYAQMISFEQGVLRGTIIRTKRLDECWDKS